MRKLLCVCMLLCLELLVVSAMWADETGKQQTVSGWVTCSKCMHKGGAAASCSKKCIQSGTGMVVVTDQGDQVLTVDNPDALKGHEGEHVAVTGQVTGSSIHVASAKTL